MNVNKIVFRFVSISFSILVMLLVLIGLFKAGNVCYAYGYRLFTEAPVDAEPGRDVVIQVTEDMSDLEVGKMLEEKGLVADGKLFFAQALIFEYSGKLHPGIYTLNTSMEIKDMLDLMSAEPVVTEEETTEIISDIQTEESETTEAEGAE